MKLLFLGGSGFLGRALVAHFGAQGHEVHAVVRSEDGAGKVRSAFADAVALAAGAVAGLAYDRVINLIVDYGRGAALLSDLIRTNLLLPLELFESVRPAAVLNISSALPADYSDYAASKKMLETSLDRLAVRRGFRAINAHLHNMYGPGFDQTNLVATLVSRMCRNQSLELASGRNARDFIYIDDVVSAIDALCSRPDAVPATVEIGSGEATVIRDLVERVRARTGSTSSIRYGARPDNEREPPILAADLAAIGATGWTPAWPLERGLDAMIAAAAT